MTSRPPPMDPGPPLAARSGAPVLYSVLGALFHLELLAPEDEDRLAAVNDLVWDWFGPKLRWQLSSFSHLPEPMSREALDYIPAYPTRLDEPETGGDLVQQAFASQLAKKVNTDYEVACHGADDSARASPFFYEFWAELPDDDQHGDRFRAFSVLKLAVPDAWPVEDFRARVLAIAAKLRLRWGAAGLTYSYFLPGDTEISFAKIYAHARRFVGYDAPYYVRGLLPLYDAIRSVNWLTFLGPPLVERLVKAGQKLVTSERVEVGAVGDNTVLRAGPAPERGDVNRLWFPPAYVEADAMVRTVRARDGKELIFPGPWSDEEKTGWLRRFEKRTS